MIIYGIQAIGESCNGWKFRALCKQMFTTRSKAEQYKNTFAERCCDREQFDFVYPPETLQITVTEHELL